VEAATTTYFSMKYLQKIGDPPNKNPHIVLVLFPGKLGWLDLAPL